MDRTEEVILELIADLHPELTPAPDTPLSGVLDSFDTVTLLAGIRTALGVAVTADKILPEHFGTPADIARLVSEIGAASRMPKTG